MTNAERIRILSARPRAPKFKLGELVREPHGSVGAVQDIYADMDAAIDARMVDRRWYDEQSIPPKTARAGIWYGVVVPDGAVLAGEDDLVAAPS